MKQSVRFKPGDQVIYRVTKHSTRPGRRAHVVSPTSNGDDYVYTIDKYRIVDQVLDNGHLVLRTRKGKIHTVQPDDPNLRRPRFWEAWFRQAAFPTYPETPLPSSQSFPTENVATGN